MFKSKRKVLNFNKKTLIISILLTFLCLPLNASAESFNVVPDAIQFYRGYNNTQISYVTSFNDYHIAGITFYGNGSGSSDYSPISARLRYQQQQFSFLNDGSRYILYFNIFSRYALQSLTLETGGSFYSCEILNTSFLDDESGYVYSMYCPNVVFRSPNLYVNYYFYNSNLFNGPVGISYTFTYLKDNLKEDISDAIQGDDLTNDDKVDDAPIKDYEEKEDAIIDTDTLDKINDIQIAIDSNSNLFIWNLVDNILNTHSLVFGMFIAILSLGLIKLILNRQVVFIKAIISGFTWLIDTITMLIDFIFGIFEVIGMVFTYLATIIDLAVNVVLTLPSWLQAFGLITIAICGVYFVIGREAGKSD